MADVVNQSELRRPRYRCRRRLLCTASVVMSAAAFVAACGSSTSTTSRTEEKTGTSSSRVDFAGTVDLGGGRKMYLECRGTGSPTVVLVSGLDAAADLWHRDEQPAPTVFPKVTRLFASTYPDEVSGMILVDVLSDGLRDAMTPEEWTIWKAANARRPQDIADYRDLERTDYDVALDQVKGAQPIRPMPLVVLSADVLYGPTLPAALDKGEIPPGTPRDFGYVIDRANKVAQEKLANLVPGAKHITKTQSGHNMMIEQPLLVTDAIREVVDAASQLDPCEIPDAAKG